MSDSAVADEQQPKLQETSLKITEIFYSLQGESLSSGLPTTFIRLTGCPLRCSYCDTAYAFSGGEWMTVATILEQVSSFPTRYVTVTGGEPLAQSRVHGLLRVPKEKMKKEFAPVGRKISRQLIKDYVIFPLLAGPFFLPVLLGNLIANGMRNVWTFTVIFCGHFTADVEVFPKSILRNETRGQWYVRQLRGSSNISGGKLLHIMTGNLSHQIEHHLFPDIPARRYAEMAVDVRDICARYGQHYNTGNMVVQFSQVIWRIVRYAFPGGKPAFDARRTAAQS